MIKKIRNTIAIAGLVAAILMPLFQPTGTHWCSTIAQKTALAFADYMHEIGGYA